MMFAVRRKLGVKKNWKPLKVEKEKKTEEKKKERGEKALLLSIIYAIGIFDKREVSWVAFVFVRSFLNDRLTQLTVRSPKVNSCVIDIQEGNIVFSTVNICVP